MYHLKRSHLYISPTSNHKFVRLTSTASEANILELKSNPLEAKIVTWIRNVSFVKPTRCSVSHEHRIIVCPSNPSTSRKTCFSPRKEEIFQNVIPPARLQIPYPIAAPATQIFHKGVLKIGHSSSLKSINNEISLLKNHQLEASSSQTLWSKDISVKFEFPVVSFLNQHSTTNP